jgi:hypothetical protein
VAGSRVQPDYVIDGIGQLWPGAGATERSDGSPP